MLKIYHISFLILLKQFLLLKSRNYQNLPIPCQRTTGILDVQENAQKLVNNSKNTSARKAISMFYILEICTVRWSKRNCN
jgi:hypothetical protein